MIITMEKIAVIDIIPEIKIIISILLSMLGDVFCCDDVDVDDWLFELIDKLEEDRLDDVSFGWVKEELILFDEEINEVELDIIFVLEEVLGRELFDEEICFIIDITNSLSK